jgi:hypothetical protein
VLHGLCFAYIKSWYSLATFAAFHRCCSRRRYRELLKLCANTTIFILSSRSLLSWLDEGWRYPAMATKGNNRAAGRCAGYRLDTWLRRPIESDQDHGY